MAMINHHYLEILFLKHASFSLKSLVEYVFLSITNFIFGAFFMCTGDGLQSLPEPLLPREQDKWDEHVCLEGVQKRRGNSAASVYFFMF